MKKQLRSAFLVTLALSLGACEHLALSLPQVDAARGFLAGARSGADLSEFEWTLTWGGETAPVIPVIVEDAFIFTNPSGVAVHFNGWQVFRVEGLLPRATITRSVEDSGEHRIYAGDRLIEEGTCMPWVRVPLEEGGFEWQQDCDPARRANRLRIDNAGNMVTIEVTVHPAFEALRLDRRVGVAEN